MLNGRFESRKFPFAKIVIVVAMCFLKSVKMEEVLC